MASRPGRDEEAPNVVALVSRWADEHLRLVRSISVVMGIAGLTLLARSLRLTSKFTCASDIPVEFLRKNVKLRGRVHRVTEDRLEIEHIPIALPILARWRREGLTETLQVRLAGVALTEAGRTWLREKLQPDQVVWFQLLSIQGPVLLCLLLVKGRIFNVNLNEEILRRGLGKAVLVDGLHPEDKAYWKVHRRVLRAELAAVRKGAGLWAEQEAQDSYVQRFRGSWLQMWGQSWSWARRLRQLLSRTLFHRKG